MSLEFPSQTRAIDPYSSYNSDIVNRLTRLITRGENCLHGTHAIDIQLDSTAANTVTILPGQCFKDDVIVNIDAPMTVDVSHSDYYINHQSPWNEAGYYWLCLEYVYSKSKPPPVARIRILKPSQHHLFDQSGAFLFLKALEVTFDGTLFHLGDIYNHDPNVPDMKRVYAQLIAGVEDSVPDFVNERDEARLIYVRDQDELYFGTSGRWESFNAIRANVNTTLCDVGQIAYLDIDGKVHPAIATGNNTLGDCGVIQIGEALNGSGKVRLYGKLLNVPIEPGRTIEEGENVYLSSVQAGSVTDLMPGSFPQFIGTSISSGSQTNTCDMWFIPSSHGGVGGGGQSWQDPYQDLLLASIFTNLHADQLSNFDFIDSTSTTAILITYDFRIDGIVGEEFVSSDLAETGWTSPIVSCQVSAEQDGNIEWYVNNSLTDEDAWEPDDLDDYHVFSEVILELTSITNGPFQIDERVESSTTTKSGFVRAFNNDKLYLAIVSKRTESWLPGEIVTATSGATGTISSITTRSLNNNLRVKAVFGAGGGSIYDYGVLYNEDEDLLNESRHHERNIETLYLDLYTTPHEDDDGNPNLLVPIETQITLLETAFDNRFSEIENNLTTAYNDIYSSPSFDNDGNPNLPTPLDVQIVNVNNRVDSTNSDVVDTNDRIDNIISGTTADFTEVNNDIDTLYADAYISPHRDNDGAPNLSMPLEAQIELRRLEQLGTQTFVDGDPTPSILSTAGSYNHQGKVWFASNTINTTIINFTDGIPGQEIDIIFNTNPGVSVTLNHNANIKLQGGVDFVGSRYDTMTLIYTGSLWVEKTRSLNS